MGAIVAFARLVPAWLWHLLALVAIAALGYGWARGQGVASAERRLLPELERWKTSAEQLGGRIREQNAAIEAMRRLATERADAAAKARATAAKLGAQLERQAAEILKTRPPAGADVCTAAREAFDHELRKERFHATPQ